MGIIHSEIKFKNRTPTAREIAAQVTRIVGLEVAVTEEPRVAESDLYDVHAKLSFVASPKSPIEITSYRPGVLKERMSLEGTNLSPFAEMVEGANETPGSQSLYLRGYIGQEVTLYFAIELACEALGGQLGEPLPDDIRREYGRPIPVAELRRRHRKVERQGALMFCLLVVLSPVIIASTLVGIFHSLRRERELDSDDGF